MSAWDNLIQRYKQQATERKPDWDRREGEAIVKELLAMAKQKGLSRYQFYRQFNADLANGSVSRRLGADGKVYVASVERKRSR
jgi:hypothetical protein